MVQSYIETAIPSDVCDFRRDSLYTCVIERYWIWILHPHQYDCRQFEMAY